MTDTAQIGEIATGLGFIRGSDCGYNTPGLWLSQDGATRIYPSGTDWTVAFFGPGQNTPFAVKTFHDSKAAFAWATKTDIA